VTVSEDVDLVVNDQQSRMEARKSLTIVGTEINVICESCGLFREF